MKTILLLLAGLSLGQPVKGASGAVNFTWFANPEPTIVAYRILCGTNPGLYVLNFLSQGTATNFTIQNTNLFEGRTNYFALTAIDADGLESNPSAEISLPLPPSRPSGFKTAQAVKLLLEDADSLAGPWQEIAFVFEPVEAASSVRFYRGRLVWGQN